MNRSADVVRELLLVSPDQWNSAIKEQMVEAYEVLVWWRSEHSSPLNAASGGLRSRCQTEQAKEPYVGQRLKRMPMILMKLHRFQKMEFARMADVGGCRAVLDSSAEVDRIRRNYEKSAPYVKTLDYVTKPKLDGYRGVHIIVRYSNRLIEVQLRTKVQHEWAEMVESLGSKLGVSLKTGVGPPEAFEFFEIVSRVQALEEQGQPADGKDMDKLATLRSYLMSLISSGGDL